MISVSETTVTSLAGNGPALGSPGTEKMVASSVSPGMSKPDPVTVTMLPPARGPAAGLIESTTGAPKT